MISSPTVIQIRSIVHCGLVWCWPIPLETFDDEEVGDDDYYDDGDDGEVKKTSNDDDDDDYDNDEDDGDDDEDDECSLMLTHCSRAGAAGLQRARVQLW